MTKSMTKRISIRAQKLDRDKERKRDDGPTIHTLIQKAMILGDEIVVRLGKPRLKTFYLSDASNALSWMLAKKFLTQGEYDAGLNLMRLRHQLFGFGVVPPPSFYRNFVSESPSEETVVGDLKTDAEKLEEAAKRLEAYEQALHWLGKLGIVERRMVQRLIASDWWPEDVVDVIAIKRGLGMLAEKWQLGEKPMPDERQTICLDFDGVIHSYTSPWTREAEIPDPPVPGALEWIDKASQVFKIAIYSSRSRNSLGVAAMRDYLRKHLTEHYRGDFGQAWELLAKIEFPHFKPPAHLTIDDRAILFNGNWGAPQYDPLSLANFHPWNKAA